MNQRTTISLYKSLSYFSRRPSIPLSETLTPISKTLQTQSNPPKSPNPTSFPPILPLPRSPISHFTHYSTHAHPRLDKEKIIDDINLKFVEAREEIESAMESKETVYFNEEAECARIAVKEALDLFHGLLEKLESNERDALRRSMGLKMEQLKAELQQLDE